MRNLYYKYIYRRWSKILHLLNLHHTRRSGPFEDGAFLDRCEWCGISQKIYPKSSRLHINEVM